MKRPDTLMLTVAGGIETCAADEAEQLGFRVGGRPVSGIVPIDAPLESLPSLHASLRSVSRVLVPLSERAVTSWDDVYDAAIAVPWAGIITPDVTFAVHASSRHQNLTDHRYLAMTVKDAIVDIQRRVGGQRSSIERRNPRIQVVAHLTRSSLALSLDATGTPLHHRGYRTEAGDAPIRETVAAAMLRLAGWHDAEKVSTLVDPMCGSGTLPIEAALMRSPDRVHYEPGRFAFERWPQLPALGWTPGDRTTSDYRRADGEPGVGRVRIFASDHDERAVAMARRNAERAGVADLIEFSVADVGEALERAGELTVESGARVVTNPPYGKRLDGELFDLYSRVGDRVRALPDEWELWLIASERELHRSLHLRSARTFDLYNGALACTYSCYPAARPADRIRG